MEVRMPSGIITIVLYCQCNSGYAVLFVQYCLEKDFETCCLAFRKLAEQFAIIKKITARNLGNAEYVLPMGNWIQHLLLKMRIELDNFLA
jgi:hypothetical protein